MKSISWGILLLLIIAMIALINGGDAISAGERVANHAIDTAAAQINQPYSVPDALERQMPAEPNHRAVVFALALLLALVAAVLALAFLYFGSPFLKNLRGLAREFRRRPAAARPPGRSAPSPALPWTRRPPVPALSAPAEAPDAEDGIAWL